MIKVMKGWVRDSGRGFFFPSFPRFPLAPTPICFQNGGLVLETLVFNKLLLPKKPGAGCENKCLLILLTLSKLCGP